MIKLLFQKQLTNKAIHPKTFSRLLLEYDKVNRIFLDGGEWALGSKIGERQLRMFYLTGAFFLSSFPK
jgi:hypothetical protein